jgi:hypothetical protein
MKIALCGGDEDSRDKLIKSFISQWPMYAMPAENIYNTDLTEDDIPEALKETYSTMNEIEKQLFGKLILIENQLEKYSDHGHLLFNGSGIDVLINALILCENEAVSEEFVEKIIYHNKKILRLLDVVYFTPNDKVNDDSPEPDKMLESVYWNFYDNYQSEFDSSPFFDHKNCASILLLESDSPINEIKMLLDKNGNLEGTSHGGDDMILDTSRLQRVLKSNPRLLEAALESIKSGNPTNVGSITL